MYLFLSIRTILPVAVKCEVSGDEVLGSGEASGKDGSNGSLGIVVPIEVLLSLLHHRFIQLQNRDVVA